MPAPRKRKRTDPEVSGTTAVPTTRTGRRGRDAAPGAEPGSKSSKKTSGNENTVSGNSKLATSTTATDPQKKDVPTTASIATSQEPAERKNEGNDHADETERRKTTSLVEQNKIAENSPTEQPMQIDSNLPVNSEEDKDNGKIGSDQEEATSRENQIRLLLEHRKILLTRLRQGKAAAQRRLDELLAIDPSRQNETQEQEIASFREKTRTATSIARKAHRADTAGAADGSEKRTSLSLRRGASVGKRMNAALTTLAPGSASAATASHAATAAAITNATNPPSGSVPLLSPDEAASIIFFDALVVSEFGSLDW